MEILIYTLIVFILVSCAFKLSQWGWISRIAFSASLAAFVLWSKQYAVLQSKTQLADYLANSAALQNMAVVVTIDTVFCFAYAFCYFQDMYEDPQKRSKWWLNILKWYPSLLMFPVTFYAFTQTLFVAVGVDFSTTTWAVAIACLADCRLLQKVANGLCLNATDEWRCNFCRVASFAYSDSFLQKAAKWCTRYRKHLPTGT